MASAQAKFFVFFFFTVNLLSLFHGSEAREYRFFNKVKTTSNDNVVIPNTNEQPLSNPPEEEPEPDFKPQNGNGYGIYGQESDQLPPSDTTTTTAEKTLPKYLPKNYNPVAYVTQPEDSTESATLTEENNTNYQLQNEDSEYKNSIDSGNSYYGGGDSFNSDPQEITSNSFLGRDPTYYGGDDSFNSDPQEITGNSFLGRDPTYYGGDSFNSDPPQEITGNSFLGGETANLRENFNSGSQTYKPQGMSDTRTLANGKYFYDVNSRKYSNSHPYASLRQTRNNQYSNGNFFSTSENAYDLNGDNFSEEYQKEDRFGEDDNNMP